MCSETTFSSMASDILNLLVNPQKNQPTPKFIMEVTNKSIADVKVMSTVALRVGFIDVVAQGGTLISMDGHLRLLELAQVPEENVSTRVTWI
ncbi:UGP2 [Cordylochernes scorpioides]|uniref:UGP2 n=1 Tax=Cordylochernes scorpioides TaxID=51811 RepID=A0ABY6L102_9ARAC|nr:UGP2 [Cordylochernes scorpioides]